MAGVVPFSGGPHGRKQWNIRDRKSNRRLRSQLAEDGCPESQLVLAKQLLQGKSVVSLNDNEENARLGVFWLIKASEQGNVEATNILRQCLETGEGITEHNYLDVKACLNTSQNEKLAKRAAREMFLSLSAGQDFITSEQLKRCMNKIDLLESSSSSKSKEGNQNAENDCLEAGKRGSGVSEENGVIRDEELDYLDTNTDRTNRCENFGEKLTEDNLENAAVTYSRGELPLVERVFALSDPQNREIENLNYLQRTLLHPLLTVEQTYLKILSHFNLRYRHIFFVLFPGSTYVQFLLIFLLHPLINTENVLLFFPMCVYYVSFFVMVVSTLQMLQSRREYGNFRVWSRLFLRYDRDGNLNTDDAEFEYCKKNLRPYGTYFLCLLLNLVSYPFISELWIPQSEFAIIAFALTFTTLYSFHGRTSKKLDFLLLFSFAINVLAKYPYESDGVVRQTWRFLDIQLPTLQSYGLPCFASQIVGSGVEFCLNFHGFFYLLIPGIFVKMASRDNWRGTYKVLIPHCVTLSWWQIAILSCQGATFYGLLRSTLALVGLVFFLPLVGIATLILPVVAVFKHFTDAALTTKTAISIILASIPIAIGYYKRRLNLGPNFIKVQVVLAIGSALFLLTPLMINYRVSESVIQERPLLTWDQYSSVCQRSSWDKTSFAALQHDCTWFEGVRVNWEGRVENVRITNIQNNILKLLDNLPESVKSKLLCYYGEKYKKNCVEEENENQMRVCKILNQVHPKDACHVNSWNKYELEISVKMNSAKWSMPESTVLLTADDSLKNFTLKLQPNDRIWFTAALNHPESLGSENLVVSAEEIGCISCSNEGLTSVKRKISRVTNGVAEPRGRHRLQLLFPLLLRISTRLATLVPTALLGLLGIIAFVVFSKKALIVSLFALLLSLSGKYAGKNEPIYIHKVNSYPDYNDEEHVYHYHGLPKHKSRYHEKWKKADRTPDAIPLRSPFGSFFDGHLDKNAPVLYPGAVAPGEWL